MSLIGSIHAFLFDFKEKNSDYYEIVFGPFS